MLKKIKKYLMEIIIFILLVVFIVKFVRMKDKTNEEIEFGGDYVDKFIRNSDDLISLNIKKIKKSAQKNISKSYLTSCSWILMNNENDKEITIYTFRDNQELLITKIGNVMRAEFEILVDNNSVLITTDDNTEHFQMVNVQDDFLYLQKIGTENLLVFANQTKFKDILKSEIRIIAKERYNFAIENF